MSLDETALTALAELAQGATQGRWRITLGSGGHLCTGIAAEFADGTSIFVADCLPSYATGTIGPKNHVPTMEYLCALTPDVVLALIAALRAARGDSARLRDAGRHFLDLAYFDVPNEYAIPPLHNVPWMGPGKPIGKAVADLWTAVSDQTQEAPDANA